MSFILALLRLGLFLLGYSLFFLADAVLFYQLIERLQVTEDVDAAPSVQVRGLEQPQIERVEVTQWHRVLLIRALLEVESFELRYLA